MDNPTIHSQDQLRRVCLAVIGVLTLIGVLYAMIG
jgi:hypothetical protein